MIEHAHTKDSTLKLARSVLEKEAQAVEHLAEHLDETF